jgi:UDP-N-acetylmuramate dehydrogenase
MSTPLTVEHQVNLAPLNSFGLPAVARRLVRITCDADVRRLLDDPAIGRLPRLVIGGGSNLVFSRDPPGVVVRVEVQGRHLVETRDDAWIVEAGAGESWHALVDWTLSQGLPGLENMALIPGTVGASPVQNIGAYGVELQDRFESLDAVDLVTGRTVTLNAAQCRFGYRDSVFKQHLAGKSVILRVRFRLPRPWAPVLGYLELERRIAETGNTAPDARTIFDWVCAIRSAKLPDPARIGNAGSFFKNPVVTADQCRDIIGRDPNVVHYPCPTGASSWPPGGSSMPAAGRARPSGTRASTRSRRWCWSTGAAPPAPRW